MDEQAATAVTAGVIFGSVLLASPFMLFGGLVLWALLGWFGVILEVAMLYGIYSTFGSAFRGALTRRAA